MERRYLQRTDVEQAHFERKCYAGGAAIIVLSVASMVTGAVRLTHWSNPSEEQNAIQRSVDELQQTQNTNNDQYRQLAIRLQETKTDDGLDEVMMIGGVLGLVGGATLAMFPGAEVKIGMGL